MMRVRWLTVLLFGLASCGEETDRGSLHAGGGEPPRSSAASEKARDVAPNSVGAALAASSVAREDIDPTLVLVYSASSQGFLEPCGCSLRGKEMGGIARRATVVDSVRAAGAPVFLVEGGDFVGGPGEAGRAIGDVTVRVMEEMGYDVIGLGEAELALGESFLQHLRQGATPVAHTNYAHPALGPAQREGLLLEKGGVRVGVIGLLDPALLRPDLGLENLVVEDPVAAATAAAASLRAAGADLVLVLGHGDFRSSGRTALQVDGADIWLVGHGGKELSQPEPVGGALLLGAGNVGKFVGILDWEADPAGAVQFSNSLHPLKLTIPEKRSVADLVRASAVPSSPHAPAEAASRS